MGSDHCAPVRRADERAGSFQHTGDKGVRHLGAGCFVQLSALLVSLAAWAISERSPLSAVFQVQPRYMLLGGAIGAFITYTVIKSMDMLGPARRSCSSWWRSFWWPI